MSISGRMRIGIDLGGSKIEGLVLDSGGNEVARRRVAAPRDGYAATVAAIADIVRELEEAIGKPGVAVVGIGTPGSVSPSTGRVQNSNSTWLNGRNLQADLEQCLARPLRMANDADCFTISEATDGAGAGARSVFGVILGTGCGGGLTIDGRLLSGPRGICGEWGHNPLPWANPDEHPGPRCWCGRHGCMETWVSGPALARDHAQSLSASAAGAIARSSTAEDVAALAAAGDAVAAASLARHASRLARGLAHVVNILDPEVIVLGGGLSKLTGLYASLPELMAPWIFCDDPVVTIRPPRWGDASGVRGAAWLWD